PTLISYLKEVLLPQLYLSLNNLSKIDVLIAFRKCAEHPYSQNIYDVAYLLMNKSNNDNPYIRTIKLFSCIEHDTKKPIKFYNIHNQDIGCVLADEHYDQAL
ncbi:12953_t:CDS:2, partial [Racocetra persica]